MYLGTKYDFNTSHVSVHAYATLVAKGEHGAAKGAREEIERVQSARKEDSINDAPSDRRITPDHEVLVDKVCRNDLLLWRGRG